MLQSGVVNPVFVEEILKSDSEVKYYFKKLNILHCICSQHQVKCFLCQESESNSTEVNGLTQTLFLSEFHVVCVSRIFNNEYSGFSR